MRSLARHEPVRGNDTVTKLPRLPHETRRLSCGCVDDVDATTSSSSSFFTPSQHLELAKFGQIWRARDLRSPAARLRRRRGSSRRGTSRRRSARRRTPRRRSTRRSWRGTSWRRAAPVGKPTSESDVLGNRSASNFDCYTALCGGGPLGTPLGGGPLGGAPLGAPGTWGAPPPDWGGGGGPRGGGPLGGGPRGGAPLGGAPRGAPGGGPRGGAPRLCANQPVSRVYSVIEAPRNLMSTQRCAVADLLVRL